MNGDIRPKPWQAMVSAGAEKVNSGTVIAVYNQDVVEVGPGTTPGNGCPSNCKSYKDQKPKGVVVNLSEF
jgi:hypothetical protein